MNDYQLDRCRVLRTNTAAPALHRMERDFQEKPQFNKLESCLSEFVGRFFKLLVNDL